MTGGRAPRVRYQPDVRLTAGCGAGAVVAAGAAVVADSAGRLLFVLAALALLGYVATDVSFRPRLEVDADGLRVRSPWGSADLAWADIQHVRADVRHRLGLRSVTLEIDAGEQLFLLTRRALGAEPEDVAGVVTAFAPPG